MTETLIHPRPYAVYNTLSHTFRKFKRYHELLSSSALVAIFADCPSNLFNRRPLLLDCVRNFLYFFVLTGCIC